MLTDITSSLQSNLCILGLCICGINQPQIANICKKIPESSKKQNLNLLHAGNYLNSIYFVRITIYRASQVALVVRNSPAKARDIRDTGSIPGSGRSPGGGHGNALQYSSLENPMDREAWQATVHRVAQSQARLKQLSTQCTLLFTPHVHCIRYYD